ncbi:hypothetical protein C2S53_006165 [Perilla frutescens var. hirtella]|uniref:F-box domain-containing protein n=1 Tax=Perilla frutescens var. hirtella TaxID=608512 RepID=A0AAD4NZU3_PERFH|nr:hypothetical protein C2S53_006165 [Perilla frutescens var. hirtella]
MKSRLGLDMLIYVFSTLPLEQLSRCRLISKEWEKHIESVNFLRLYLARSDRMLLVLRKGQKSSCCQIYKFLDEVNPAVKDNDDRRYVAQSRSVFPHPAEILGSAGGLLLLIKVDDRLLHENLFVWNPFFKYYFNLNHPPSLKSTTEATCYGFGVDNLLKRYKVVRILFSNDVPHSTSTVRGEVFTVGPEQEQGWRVVQPVDGFTYNANEFGALVNGNLHWLVSDSDKKWMISCFDIETECFTTFSTPLCIKENKAFHGGVTVLNGRLCLHEIKDSNESHQTAIWVLNNYNNHAEKEWKLEVVVDNDEEFGGFFTSYPRLTCYPLHLFANDDDVLMVGDLDILYNYSKKTKRSSEIDIFRRNECYGIIHNPCYLSLKSIVGVEDPHITTIGETDIDEDI